MRKSGLFTASIATLGLLLGFITFPQSASAVGVVTKTITVLGPNGLPYQGALVGVKYFSVSRGFNYNGLSETVTTNSSGVANVSYPDDAWEPRVVVQPPQSDNQTASKMEYISENARTNGTITIQLEQANMAFQLLMPDGSDVPAGMQVRNEANSGFFNVETIRSGAFGVYVNSDVVINQCIRMMLIPNFGFNDYEASQNVLFSKYSMKVTEASAVKTYRLYNGSACNLEIAPSSGVFRISGSASNISGNLRNSSGGPLNLTSTEGYGVEFVPIGSNGWPDYSRPSGEVGLKSNGDWFGMLETATAGKYRLVFSAWESSSKPTFIGNSFWIDSNGKFSPNSDLSSPVNTLVVNTNSPTPNLKIKILDPESGNAAGGFVRIETSTADGDFSAGMGSGSFSGESTFKLEDGIYRIRVQANTWEIPGVYQEGTQFELAISGGVASVIAPSGATATLSAGTWQLKGAPANGKFKFVNETGTALGVTEGYLNVCQQTGPNSRQCTNIGDDGTTYKSTLRDGNWTLQFTAWGDSNVSSVNYSASVSGGVVTIVGTTLDEAGNIVLTAPSKNLKALIVDPSDNSPVPNTSIQVWKKSDNSDMGNSSGRPISPGKVGMYLPDGEYWLNAYPDDSSSPLQQQLFDVSVVAGDISITLNGDTVNKVGNEFILPLQRPNLKFKLVTETGTILGNTQGYMSACTTSPPKKCAQANLNTSGNTAALTDGSWNLSFTAWGDSGVSSNNYPVLVSGGVATIAGTSVDGSGNFILPVQTSNFQGLVVDPDTNLPVSETNIQLTRKLNKEYYGYSPGNARSPGIVGTYIADGEYWMNVYPNAQGSSLQGQNFDVSVVAGVISVSLNGVSVNKVGNQFVLPLLSTNFQVKMVDLSGAAVSGHFEYCQISDSGFQSNCGGRGVDNLGRGSAFLSNGNWKITVNPNSSTVVAKTYSASVTGGVVTVSGATKTGSVWTLPGATPNISGLLKDANGNLTFAQGQGMSLQPQKYVTDHWEWQNGGTWKQSANWGVNITNAGRYRMVAVPYGFTDLAQTNSSEFWVNGSGKVSATGVTGSYVDTLTVNIVMKQPNLKFKVTNPIDNLPLSSGWIEIRKVTGNSSEYIGNADINGATAGLTSTYLSEVGEYILRVNPPQGTDSIVGLAPKEYRAIVSALDSVTVTSGGSTVAKDGVRFIVSPSKANLTAKTVYPNGNSFGNTNGKWLNANLQKWQSSKGYWEFGTNANANQDGYVSLTVTEAGKYRLRLEPQGDSEVTVTYSEEFTVTSEGLATFEKNLGNIFLVGPSIKVAVKAGLSERLTYTGIEIRKNGQWIDWANTQSTGIAAISLPSDGEFEFIVQPNNEISASASRKSYFVTATKSAEGVITAVAKTASGVSVASDVTTLMLGTPTISGTVKNPGDTAAVPNSQVVALDVATNREMWEFSSNTNQNGQWSMSLPKGTYKIMARAPWGVADFGNSAYSTNVVVDETGSATTLPVGLTSTTFKILLQNPTWSGTVKTPDGTATIANARVCLRLNQIWNCTNSTNSGSWALSAPAGYTGNFESWVTDAYLESADDIGRQYTMYRADTKSAVKAKLGNGGSGIEIRLTSPNTRITVTAGGQAASNIWVNAERDGEGWLGGASTNAEGIASLNITNPSTSFRIRADIGGNPLLGANYSTTQKTYSASEITAATSGGVFTKTIPLDTPNFRVVVREPRADGSVGPIVTGTWVDMFNESTGEWMGGTNTNSNGVSAFKVAAPTSCSDLIYRLNVNQPWSTTTNYSRQSYKLLIKCNGDITLSNALTDAVVTKELVGDVYAYSVTLGLPSITGVVVNPANVPVPNSWIVPVNTSTYEWMWQIGSNSRSDGTFGISAPSGNYRIEANVPYGLSDVAKPAPCTVTVANGGVTTVGGCVQANKSLVLALRAPNVSFTLKSGGNPVSNANVSFSAGKWYTNAQTNSEGKVSFFIDAEEIRTMNGTSSAIPLRVWVDPPYSSSTLARWDCEAGDLTKPICSGLVAIPASGNYPEKLLGDVTGVQPNTKVRVLYPDTTAAVGAWVNIFTIKPSDNSYGKRWLAAGGSDSEGYVAFNIDTLTVTSGATYVVEVNSPWNKRSLFSSKEHTNSGAGFSWSGVNNQSFELASPNLKITVYAPNGIDRSKWGWLGIQEVDNSGNYLNWVGGYGLDDAAATSVYLAASKRYRIFVNPGPGRPGTQTDCIVQTNVSAVVSQVSGGCPTGTFSGSDTVRISLNGGNVVGRVVRLSDDSNVAGAIVFANPVGASDESGAVISCTSDEGLYGLELDKTKTWNIKIFPVKKADETELVSQTVSNVQPLNSGTKTLETIKLANK
jgi:hypothetical protein